MNIKNDLYKIGENIYKGISEEINFSDSWWKDNLKLFENLNSSADKLLELCDTIIKNVRDQEDNGYDWKTDLDIRRKVNEGINILEKRHNNELLIEAFAKYSPESIRTKVYQAYSDSVSYFDDVVRENIWKLSVLNSGRNIKLDDLKDYKNVSNLWWWFDGIEIGEDVVFSLDWYAHLFYEYNIIGELKKYWEMEDNFDEFISSLQKEGGKTKFSSTDANHINEENLILQAAAAGTDEITPKSNFKSRSILSIKDKFLISLEYNGIEKYLVIKKLINFPDSFKIFNLNNTPIEGETHSYKDNIISYDVTKYSELEIHYDNIDDITIHI